MSTREAQSALLGENLPCRKTLRTLYVLAHFVPFSLDCLCIAFAIQDLGCHIQLGFLSHSLWMWCFGVVDLLNSVLNLVFLCYDCVGEKEVKFKLCWKFVLSLFVLLWCILGGILLFQSTFSLSTACFFKFAFFIWLWLLIRTLFFFWELVTRIALKIHTFLLESPDI